MYQTTPRRSTRETPFSMTYGVEVVIPLETGFPTLRSKRKRHGLIGLLSTQVQVRVCCQRKTKATSTWRLGPKKGRRNCKKPSMRKIGTQLERTISYHINSWKMCLFPWRSKRKGCTTLLECKQLEKISLLMKAFFTIFGFVILCAMLSAICSNIKLNLGYAWFLGSHTLGKLIF